jgi:hypothetical protein
MEEMKKSFKKKLMDWMEKTNDDFPDIWKERLK